MLKAYFLKEDPLWFAFWGLLTTAERGASARHRHVEGRCGNNQAGVAARRQSAGVNMVGVKSGHPSLLLLPFIVCSRPRRGGTYNAAPNYRVLLLLWYAVP